MHLTALVESTDHVCCRYRLTAFRSALERAGHSLELLALPSGWLGRWRLFRSLRGVHVILQRRLLSPWLLAPLRRAARTLIFDFDDAVLLRNSFAPKGLHDRRRSLRFKSVIKACDAVAAGNAFLAEQAAGCRSRCHIDVIPTCVDPGRYPMAEQARAESTQLVWVGSSSTLKGLEAIAPLLTTIGRRVPGILLKLICDRFFAPPDLTTLPCLWSAAGEAAEIAAADIGIAHVPDDLWSRGKCGLKVLQYMAAGLPVVANPVGVHGEMVRHGETGFLAETPAQWVEAIGRFGARPEPPQANGTRGPTAGGGGVQHRRRRGALVPIARLLVEE